MDEKQKSEGIQKLARQKAYNVLAVCLIVFTVVWLLIYSTQAGKPGIERTYNVGSYAVMFLVLSGVITYFSYRQALKKLLLKNDNLSDADVMEKPSTIVDKKSGQQVNIKAVALQSAYKAIAIWLPIFFVAWIIGAVGFAVGHTDNPAPESQTAQDYAAFYIFLIALFAFISYRRKLNKLTDEAQKSVKLDSQNPKSN